MNENCTYQWSKGRRGLRKGRRGLREVRYSTYIRRCIVVARVLIKAILRTVEQDEREWYVRINGVRVLRGLRKDL